MNIICGGPGPAGGPEPVGGPGPGGDLGRWQNQQETQGTLAQHKRFLGINFNCKALES